MKNKKQGQLVSNISGSSNCSANNLLPYRDN